MSRSDGIIVFKDVSYEYDATRPILKLASWGMILAGVILAVVAAVTIQLAGDTGGGVNGYVQNLAIIDQQTLELGDQVLLRSAQLEALVAQEKAAQKTKH